MAFIGLLWRLARRRWVRRLLVWLVIRLLRLFGWRRVVRLLFRGRTPWRVLAAGVWRAAVWLLRRSPVLIPLVWPRARALRRLTRPGDTRRSGFLTTPQPQGAGASWTLQLSRSVRANMSPRLARRRDEIRRSLFAAVGVDPDWMPPSRRRASGARSVTGSNRAELGETTSY